ncbi:AMP-binding protein [Dactylosporangium sp. AC04546]|uniref:AMP-binding protein n=1 Tax=Dactylosporangium sp. AC04546 TaxID=2862460 RepID=UPI002E7B55CC|nr:AMP-binding protein [Dactylosporangium sp. AC04546]WVK86958.1 AMP-binding protein [Dactylosporangium sp. AC04546]
MRASALPGARTITDALDAAVAADESRMFIECDGDAFSYGDILRRSVAFAAGLEQIGATPGGRVATLLECRSEAVVAWMATSRLGGVFVPLNPSLDVDAILHQLRDSGARVLVTPGSLGIRLAEREPDVLSLPTFVTLDETAGTWPAGAVHVPFGALCTSARPKCVPAPAPGQLAALLYTSGTTGTSKSCMISHNYLCLAGHQVAEDSGQGPDDTVYLPLPFFHINVLTTIVGTMLAKGRVALAPRFEADRFWPEIRRTGATITALLGSMVQAATSAADHVDPSAEPGRLRVVRGGPFSAEETRVWRDRLGVSRVGSQAYGSTEVARMTNLGPTDEIRTGSLGRRNQYYDVRVVDDQDEECAPGEVGEIVCRPLRSHIMFDGYWNRPDETIRAFRNLWFHTGDLGRFDDDGYLYFVDRRKHHLAGAGGLSSSEVEAIVLQHPVIREVAAYEVRANEAADPAVALAVVVNGRLDPDTLWSWLRARLPGAAQPRFVRLVGELPRNQVGRVQKYRLSEEAIPPGTWERPV